MSRQGDTAPSLKARFFLSHWATIYGWGVEVGALNLLAFCIHTITVGPVASTRHGEAAYTAGEEAPRASELREPSGAFSGVTVRPPPSHRFVSSRLVSLPYKYMFFSIWCYVLFFFPFVFAVCLSDKRGRARGGRMYSSNGDSDAPSKKLLSSLTRLFRFRDGTVKGDREPLGAENG